MACGHSRSAMAVPAGAPPTPSTSTPAGLFGETHRPLFRLGLSTAGSRLARRAPRKRSLVQADLDVPLQLIDLQGRPPRHLQQRAPRPCSNMTSGPSNAALGPTWRRTKATSRPIPSTIWSPWRQKRDAAIRRAASVKALKAEVRFPVPPVTMRPYGGPALTAPGQRLRRN